MSQQHMTPETLPDAALEVLKITPPAVVGFANAMGVGVPELINFATLIYVGGLAIGMLWKAGVKLSGWLGKRKQA